MWVKKGVAKESVWEFLSQTDTVGRLVDRSQASLLFSLMLSLYKTSFVVRSFLRRRSVGLTNEIAFFSSTHTRITRDGKYMNGAKHKYPFTWRVFTSMEPMD